MGYSMNTKKYHYIEWYTWDPETGTRGELKSIELFDSENDPNETENIAKEQELKEVITGLSKQLASGWQKATPSTLE
ncbi:MAG: iduronate 2-sulfatase [Maribacter sp.]|jgi:iduronate 2-sulfatase|tara:strand:+ start:366 stop:596 length:231 start_codon:yes stop_codon:yes gene_type:complete